jgi:hypothetical protein
MFKTLKKYSAVISVLLIIAILASLFFWPGITATLGRFALVMSIGMVVAFSLQKHVRARQEGGIDNLTLLRNSAIELLGILLTMAPAIFAGRWATEWATRLAVQAAEQTWPGARIPLGILAGLLAALIVGLLVGFVVQSTWESWPSVNRPRRRKAKFNKCEE